MNSTKGLKSKILSIGLVTTIIPCLFISSQAYDYRANGYYLESAKYSRILSSFSSYYQKMTYMNYIDYSLQHIDPFEFCPTNTRISVDMKYILQDIINKDQFKNKLPSIYSFVSYYTERNYKATKKFTENDLNKLELLQDSLKTNQINLHYSNLVDVLLNCEKCLILTNLAYQSLSSKNMLNDNFIRSKEYYHKYLATVNEYSTTTKMKSFFLRYNVKLHKEIITNLESYIDSQNVEKKDYDLMIQLIDTFKSSITNLKNS